ncbi:MAG TPA: hypothetical protein VGO52_20800 [Hyphomonadaceae bacterium]|jgi:hypothetical protein|nr:hypothetical protein [Hyphomonadaceae bacterium]
MDPLAARIIGFSQPEPGRAGRRGPARPAGPVLLRNTPRRGRNQHLAIYVTWLDELPGARR